MGRLSLGSWLVFGLAAAACGGRSQLFGGELLGSDVGGASSGAGGAAGVSSFGGAPRPGGGVSSMAGNETGGSPGKAGSGGQLPMGGNAPVQGGFGTAGEPDEVGGEGGAGPLPEPVEVTWGKRFGSAEVAQRAQAIAVEPNGDFTLTGTIFGFVDFGGGALSSPNQASAFLARFDTDGAHQWSKAFAGSGPQYALGLDVASNGVLAISGYYSGGVDFGGGTLQSIGGSDAFLATFESDGQYRSGKRFGGQLASSANDVAIGLSGTPTLVGHFTGDIDLGGGTLSASGSGDVFAAGFDQDDGDHSWSNRGGDEGLQRANAVARVTLDDSVVVAGQFSSTLRLGACSTMTSQGSDDAFLGWLTSYGECLQSTRFGDDNHQAVYAVATGKSFSTLVAIAGEFHGAINIAGITKQAVDGDAFVALYTVDTGLFSLAGAWLDQISGEGEQVARAVTFDAQDNLIVVGDYGAAEAFDQRDIFVIKYSFNGARLWTKRLSGHGAHYANAVGTDSAGNVYVAGYFEGDLALSTGTLVSAGSEDIFVVKLAP